MNHTEQKYIQLITDLLSGNATEEQKALAKQLSSESEQFRNTLAAYKTIWKNTEEIHPEHQWDIEKALKKTEKKIKIAEHKKYQVRYRLLAAAVVILIPVIAFFWQQNTKEFSQSITARNDSIAKLSDGSTINLAPNTTLWSSDFENADMRRIKLEGEAFFEVKRNPEKPFVVETDGAIVEVLGTTFNVKTEGPRTEVYVKSGKVRMSSRLEAENVQESIVLFPGEIGIWSEADGLQKKAAQPANANTIFRVDKCLFYEGTPLIEVFEDLDNYYAVKVNVPDSSLLHKRFTGKFENESIDHIMQVLAVSFQLEYENNGNQYLLRQADSSFSAVD